jgi:outer membrane protein assembly factor BamB
MVVYNTTLAENLVYYVSVVGTVDAFDAPTGAKVWTQSVGGVVVGYPAIDTNRLYTGNELGSFHELGVLRSGS